MWDPLAPVWRNLSSPKPERPLLLAPSPVDTPKGGNMDGLGPKSHSQERASHWPSPGHLFFSHLINHCSGRVGHMGQKEWQGAVTSGGSTQWQSLSWCLLT